MKMIETERLQLKLISTDDASFILELYNTPTFIHHIGDKNIRSIEDAENYIKEKFIPQAEKHHFGNYVIIRKEDQKSIGAVGIYVREGMEIPDIGFAFLPEFVKKGYAYESASKLISVAFNEFNLKKISAFTTKDNISSQNLIQKIGLKYQETKVLPGFEEEMRYYLLEK